MKKLKESISYLKSKGIIEPKLGIVLGTGLGNLVDLINIECIIDYENIPHFPISTVESHKGKLIYGDLDGIKVLAMQGRFHYYEGYSFNELTSPIRIMKLLGIENLLLSNACGSLNPLMKKTSLMLLDDHIDLLPGNPLVGQNYKEMGPRFPDMSEPYSKLLNDKFKEAAQECNIELFEGVYVAVGGPNLETRAEYRFLRTIGADVVGMSTVPEVIVANQINLPCAAISVITDECDPDHLEKAELSDILDAAKKAEKKLVQLISAFVKKI